MKNSFLRITSTKAFSFLICTLFTLFITALPALAGSATIREDIIKAIENKPGFGAHNIEIEARHGVVTLSGVVASEEDRYFVVETAKRQADVKEVRDNLEVKIYRGAPTNASVNDKELAQAVKRNIAALSLKHNYSLSVLSRNGNVTLSGSAGCIEDAQAMGKAAQSTAGVRSVENKIMFKTYSDAEINSMIKTALEKNHEINLKGVSWEVMNGVATFHGTLANHKEIDRILSTALMVQGVKDVKNEIKLSKHKKGAKK